MKKCYKCGKELDESMFYKDSTAKDGLQSWCKSCKAEYSKKWKKDNYEKVKEAQKSWFKNHPNYQKDRYRENIDRSKNWQRKYRENNKDLINERQRKYYSEHKEMYSEKNMVKRKNGKEKRNEYERRRRKEDEFHKFKLYIRHFVWESFNRKSWEKCGITEEIIGCSFEDAKEHLEKTWFTNYGTEYNGESVHIDHITPICTAKNKEEVLRLCHISNLQYLKPEDNLRKKDKLYWKLD